MSTPPPSPSPYCAVPGLLFFPTVPPCLPPHWRRPRLLSWNNLLSAEHSEAVASGFLLLFICGNSAFCAFLCLFYLSSSSRSGEAGRVCPPPGGGIYPPCGGRDISPPFPIFLPILPSSDDACVGCFGFPFVCVCFPFCVSFLFLFFLPWYLAPYLALSFLVSFCYTYFLALRFVNFAEKFFLPVFHTSCWQTVFCYSLTSARRAIDFVRPFVK